MYMHYKYLTMLYVLVNILSVFRFIIDFHETLHQVADARYKRAVSARLIDQQLCVKLEMNYTNEADCVDASTVFIIDQFLPL